MKIRQFFKERNISVIILPLILIAFIVILGFTLHTVYGKKSQKKPQSIEIEGTTSSEQKKSNTMLGIVTKHDKEGKLLTITKIDDKVEVLLDYDSETVFTNRYDEKMNVAQMVLGEIVSITYNVETNHLLECHATNEAWEYKKVTNWSIDKTKSTVVVGKQSYQYDENFYIFNSKSQIDSNLLSEKDELMIKGIGGQVYSIIVTKGHGYVKLSNYDAFLGGSIEIGYDIITKIEEDMVMIVREGQYKVTLKNGSLEVTKYITVLPDLETTVDMSDYKVELVRKGKVQFDIKPNGADLFINKKQVSYQKPLELAYGDYEVKVSLAGYESYEATLTVDQPYETLYITLVEENAVSPSPTPEVTIEDTDDGDISTQTPKPTSEPMEEGTTTETKIDKNHMINILTPVGAEVYINNEYKGTIPLSIPKIIGKDLSLKLTMEGKDSKTYTLDVIDDNQNVTWNFNQWW